VLVTGDSAMRRLNARFRGKKTATDVLSFPAVACPKRLAGDIAVSADIALRNARRLGHSPSAEVRILILHGILHLAGYDHQANHGEMARRERRLRGRLALPGGLIERSSRRAARSRP
jgi:probable rRNA maturation factor